MNISFDLDGLSGELTAGRSNRKSLEVSFIPGYFSSYKFIIAYT